jgi:hypothetical protein
MEWESIPTFKKAAMCHLFQDSAAMGPKSE